MTPPRPLHAAPALLIACVVAATASAAAAPAAPPEAPPVGAASPAESALDAARAPVELLLEIGPPGGGPCRPACATE